MMRAANEDEIKRWDELVAANPDAGNPLQGKAFALTKQNHGWQPHYQIHEHKGLTIAALYLSRTLPALGPIWYCPQGPGVTDLSQLKPILSDLKSVKAFVIKMEPLLSRDHSDKLKNLGLVKPPREVQYNTNTVTVDLTPDENDIIASFRQKTRYNIRLALRKEVVVKPVPTTDESMSIMYSLMEATQGRAGFFLRDKGYFTDFWRLHAEQGSGQQFFAYYEGKILAGAYVSFVGTYALYKDGGSVREHTDLQPPYALQWEAMRWLKQRGITRYDMHGTPPQASIDDSSHPLAGLARFKTGFNPDVLEYAGAWDLPLNAAKYKLWLKFGERAAMAAEQRLKKRLFY